LLTLRGAGGPRRGADLRELGIIADGALLICDGVITEVGPTRRVENLRMARSALEINAAGRVVMPGFVDSHTHLLFPPPGGAADRETDTPTAAADTAARLVRATTAQRLEMRARTYLEAMARHGTTTLETKTGCGPDESAELKLLRVASALNRDPIDIVPTFLCRMPGHASTYSGHDEARVLTELLPKIRRRGLASFADLAWDPDPARHACFARYLQTARSLGFGCKLHAAGPGCAVAITMAIEHLAISIEHLEHATPGEVAVLAGSSTMATVLPSASFSNGGCLAPARGLIDAGVPIAIATNFNFHHSPSLNMQTAISLACMRMGMTAGEAISAATINGAHSLGRAARIGSLEPGKSADLLILNVHDYRELGHHFGTNLVRMTMKRGKFIYKEGEVAPRFPKKLPLAG